MLNLLRFRPGGEPAYRDYLARATPLIERLGGQVVHAGSLGPTLVASEGPEWQAVVLIRWPNREALRRLVADSEYQTLNQIRMGALAGTLLQASDVWLDAPA
jgi:uncharacterized protein (DUF1330 family)